jgi:hypothetical protein
MLLLAIILSDCTSLLMGGAACSRYQAYWYSHRSNEFNAAQRLRCVPGMFNSSEVKVFHPT